MFVASLGTSGAQTETIKASYTIYNAFLQHEYSMHRKTEYNDSAIFFFRPTFAGGKPTISEPKKPSFIIHASADLRSRLFPSSVPLTFSLMLFSDAAKNGPLTKCVLSPALSLFPYLCTLSGGKSGLFFIESGWVPLWKYTQTPAVQQQWLDAFVVVSKRKRGDFWTLSTCLRFPEKFRLFFYYDTPEVGANKHPFISRKSPSCSKEEVPIADNFIKKVALLDDKQDFLFIRKTFAHHYFPRIFFREIRCCVDGRLL